MKKYILTLLTFFLFFCFSTNVQAIEINSKHAIMYNLNDNTIIYEKEAYQKTAIASLTKIMTCLVSIENIDNLDSKITINRDAFTGLAEANASLAGFHIGDQVTYLDLLMGLFLPSGADAARALAINIAGNEENFVKLMNQKAKDLNLANTHFVNITGLDTEGHYSTVYDIANLLKYALSNPTFKQIYETNQYITTNNLKFYSTRITSTKNYSLDISKINGSKTGYTGDAGLCLASTATYNNVNFLLVTTGANPNANIPYNFTDALSLYSYYYNNYSYQNILNKDQLLVTLDVDYSSNNSYNVLAQESIQKYLPNSFSINEITYEWNGPSKISYKNHLGDKLGTIDIIYNEKILESIDVYLNNKISFNLISYLIQTKIIYPIGIITIIFIFLIVLLNKKINSH